MSKAKPIRNGLIPLILGGKVDPILQVFLSEVEAEEITNGVRIICPNEIITTIITQKYGNRIEEAVQQLHGEKAKIEYVTREVSCSGKTPMLFPETAPLPSSPLNRNYTFENWVVGQSNQMASVAALAVAEASGTVYNPLFIYGGVGLGKTHLLHAIGNYTLKHKNEHCFCYITSEEFTSEFIQALQEKRLNYFRKKYRNFQLLLIDDIQFFENKEQTQEAFFHLFNSMITNNRQVVLTSDCPPSELQKFTERLVSRFSSGLVADIQPPELETRIAILKKKSQEFPMQIPEEYLYFIAENFPDNVRNLEGALHRVLIYLSLHPSETFSVGSNCERIFSDLKKSKKLLPSFERIIQSVADTFHLSTDLLLSKKRNYEIVYARQVAIYLVRKLLSLSLPDIGKRFQKDHTTILHSLSIMEKKLSSDAKLKTLISEIEKKLNHYG